MSSSSVEYDGDKMKSVTRKNAFVEYIALRAKCGEPIAAGSSDGECGRESCRVDATLQRSQDHV
jgi:hypothetical protein